MMFSVNKFLVTFVYTHNVREKLLFLKVTQKLQNQKFKRIKKPLLIFLFPIGNYKLFYT